MTDDSDGPTGSTAVVETACRRTRRWRGIVAVALAAMGAGLLSLRPALFFLAIVGVGFALYSRLWGRPPVPEIACERTLSRSDPSPGEEVTVTLTVRNEGDTWLTDLRIVDGVPALLTVVAGTPRIATTLGPGRAATLEYTINAEPGKHRFQPITVVSRDPSGAVERTTTLATPTVLNCMTPLVEIPLAEQTGTHPGPLPAGERGRGIEFDRTREYQRGDSLDRVDWRRYARSGELSTIEYRPERSARVIITIDVGAATVSPVSFDTDVTPEALARSLAAADHIATALTANHHAVGLAVSGRPHFFIPPRTGDDHGRRLRTALDSDPVFAVPPDHSPDDAARSTGALEPDRDGSEYAALRTNGGSVELGLRERVGRRDQVLFITPLLDDEMLRHIVSFQSAEERVLVVTPEVSMATGPAGRLAALARSARIRALRAAGIPVLDWTTDAALATTLLEWVEQSTG